jgi:hypothetical protein
MRHAAVAVAGLAVLASGCATSTASAPNATPSSGPPAASSPATGQAFPGTILFPVAVGRTWVFRTSVGSAHGTVTEKIVSVAPAAGGAHQVTMSIVSRISGLPAPPVRQVFLFHPDGSISVPLTQAAGGSFTLKSGDVVWPPAPVLASRQPHASTLVIAVRAAGRSLTEHARLVVRGMGTQRITVPAGTYGASVVDELITVRIGPISAHVELRTWLVPGIGPVKSQTIESGAGQSIVASQVLTKITP